MKLRAAILLALFTGLPTASLSTTAQAASVYGIAQNDLQMNTLGTPYIHSRHTGLMPYWGPCERCTTQMVSEPACTVGSQPQTLATWTNAGNSSCGGYESDTFTATTQCSLSGVVQLVITNNSYNPADTTGKVNYGINIPLTVPNGGNYGTQLNMNDVFGGNNCSQNFDWYPSFGITGEDVNGTFNGTITFGNYLSPSQYAQSPTFPVVFQNYKLVSVRTCKQYAPTSTECQTPPARLPTEPILLRLGLQYGGKWLAECGVYEQAPSQLRSAVDIRSKRRHHRHRAGRIFGHAGAICQSHKCCHARHAHFRRR
jgi:hypothetical protein